MARDRDSDIGNVDTEPSNLVELSEARDRPEEGETSYDVAVRVHRVAAEWRARHAEQGRQIKNFFGAIFDRQDKHERKLEARHEAFTKSTNDRFDKLEAKLDGQKKIGWTIALSLVAIAWMMYSRG
jgi:hypothetical protein